MGTKGRKLQLMEAQNIAMNLVAHIIKKCSSKGLVTAVILGSVMRNAPEVGDIDILVVMDDDHGLDDIKNVVLYKDSAILSSGDRVIHALLKDNTQIDIYMCHKDEYPCMYNYLAGPSASNIRLRAKAKKLGYKLNQYDLVDATTGESVLTRDDKYNNDEEVYEKLGLKYKQLWER